MELGVNTHFSYPNIYKADPSGVCTLIKLLGFTIVRENHAAGVAIAKAAGLRVIGVAGNGTVAKAMLEAKCDWLEGPNEFNSPDMRGGYVALDWMDELRRRWRAMVAERDAFQKLSGKRVPMLAPSFSNGNQDQAIADARKIGAFIEADFGNLHVYPANQTPANYLARVQKCRAISDAMAPGKPVVLTEFGTWHAGVNTAAAQAKTGHIATDPVQAAKLYPGYLDGLASLGIAIACLYEFADEVDKQALTRRNPHEGYFGVVDASLNSKAHTAILAGAAGRLNGSGPAIAERDDALRRLTESQRQLQVESGRVATAKQLSHDAADKIAAV